MSTSSFSQSAHPVVHPIVPEQEKKPAAEKLEQQPRSPTLAYVAFGVGGAGLAVGSVFGALALSKRGNLNSACVDKVSPPSEQSNIDSAHTRGNVSTVGFIVGGVGIAVGATWLLWPNPPRPRADVGLVLRPFVSLNSAGVQARF